MRYLLILLFIIYSAHSIDFGERQNKGIIEYNQLDENSGMVVGIENDQLIWSINDGASNEIYGFDKNGKSVSILHFKKKILNDNSDIEDIAICKIDGISYIILSDTGDNSENRKNCFIYFIPEPKSSDIISDIEINASDIITIEVTYEDGPRDAECLLADPITNNLYLITKREKNARLYELKYPFKNDEKRVFEFKHTLEFGNNIDLGYTSVTGGDISKDGYNILIREYSNIFYFHRNTNQDISEALENPFQKIESYIYSLDDEPQGESICWENNLEGFYTASEEKSFSGYDAPLFFFKATTSSIKKKENRIQFENNILTNLESKDVNMKLYNYLGQKLKEINLPPYESYYLNDNTFQAHYLLIDDGNKFYKIGISVK